MGANVNKTIDALAIGSETIVWTPASGKKFRVMGGLLTVTGGAGDVIFRDGIGGPTLFVIPNSVLGTPIPFDFGDGFIASSKDNKLTATGVLLAVLNGDIWGTEE